MHANAGTCLLAAVLSVVGCARDEADRESREVGEGGSGEAGARPSRELDLPIEKPVPGDAAKAAERVAEARRELACGRPDQAKKACLEALRLDPACLDALLLRGTMDLSRGMGFEPTRALLAFRMAQLVEPGNVPARVGEAVARTEVQDDERAAPLARALVEEAESKRIAMPPEQLAAAHRCLAAVAHRAGRFDEGLREVEAALVLRPNDRASLTLRAQLLERTERFAEAEADLRRAIDLKPDDASLHFARARVLRRLGRDDDAARETRIHRALAPFEETAAKSFETDWDRRIELRQELVAAFPEFRRARHLLVREFLQAKRLAEAYEIAERLTSEQPGDAEAWYLLARILARQGDRDAARAAAAKMLAADPARRVLHDDLLREIEIGRDEREGE